MEKLVFDTSAILNCGKRGELDFLLERLAEGHSLLTTPEVESELLDPENRVYYQAFLRKHFKLQEVKSVKIDFRELQHLAAILGKGELSVLLLAMEQNSVAVLDEKTARGEAERLKIRVMGTLGILARSIERKWCTDHQCVKIVVRLHNSGFRIRRPEANETFVKYFASMGKQSRAWE